MSHRLAFEPGRWSTSEEGLWTGGVHLAHSFDTVGVFVRDPRDTPAAVNGIFGIEPAELGPTVRIYVGDTLAESGAYSTDSEALGHTRVVLAHELGHRVHRDIWRLLSMSVVTTAAGVLGAWAKVERTERAAAA